MVFAFDSRNLDEYVHSIVLKGHFRVAALDAALDRHRSPEREDGAVFSLNFGAVAKI